MFLKFPQAIAEMQLGRIMTFASKLLLGSMASLLLGSIAFMHVTHYRWKEQLREEFAIRSENTVMNLGKVLSNLEGGEKSVCSFLKNISEIGYFSYISMSRGNRRVCFFGREDYLGVNLRNIDSSLEKLEVNKVYSTYAIIECKTPGCMSMELEAGTNFSDLNRALQLIWMNQIKGTLAQVVCATLFLIIFSFIVKRRLEILSLACEQIQKGSFDLNLKISGKDEISNIGNAMKVMAQNLRMVELEKDRQRSTSQHTSKMTALGEMAAGIAHEINNPLMIISGKAQKSIRSIRDGNFDTEEFKENLEKIVFTSNRIGKIISGLRAFSRNGEKDPLIRVSLKSIITDTCDLCSEKFRQNGVQLSINDFPDQVVKCRSVQISQVLLNLLNNSYDAIQGNAEKWIKISATVKEGHISIRVADSGRGISQEIVDKMMQPFFTTKEIGKGTGLGLSISNGIISDHKGKMYYELSEGNTSFVIELPIYTETNQLAS